MGIPVATAFLIYYWVYPIHNTYPPIEGYKLFLINSNNGCTIGYTLTDDYGIFSGTVYSVSNPLDPSTYERKGETRHYIPTCHSVRQNAIFDPTPYMGGIPTE